MCSRSTPTVCSSATAPSSGHGRARVRAHRQRRVDRGQGGQPDGGRLLGVQGGGDRADEGDRQGSRPHRRCCQLRRARGHRDADPRRRLAGAHRLHGRAHPDGPHGARGRGRRARSAGSRARSARSRPARPTTSRAGGPSTDARADARHRRARLPRRVDDQGAARRGRGAGRLDLGEDDPGCGSCSTRRSATRVTLVAGDITDGEALGRALDEHEITRVVHLAALQVPFCRADPCAARRSTCSARSPSSRR